MTWKEFKAEAERQGVKDSDEVKEILYSWRDDEPDSFAAESENNQAKIWNT